MTANVNPSAFEDSRFPDELEPGTSLLHGQYTIDQFLNSGGFGITYLARDSLDRRVVIKECFPSAFCRRSNRIVCVRSRAHQAEFSSTVKHFVQEARNLAKLKHPNIVGVHQVFEDNETAYMALDFIDGRDLLDILDDPKDSISSDEIQSMTRRLLDAVQFVHTRGMLHRDISPDNILLTADRNPVLIDFGAAREEAAKSSRVLSAMRVVKDGYSPQEFYINGSQQGPSSDLYALGASIYHLITGAAPPDSQARLAAVASGEEDPFRALGSGVAGYPPEFLSAINSALNIFPNDRIQSAADWLTMLDNPADTVIPTETPQRVQSRRPLEVVAEKPRPTPRSEDAVQSAIRAADPKPRSKGGMGMLLAGVAIVGAAGVYFAAPMLLQSDDSGPVASVNGPTLAAPEVAEISGATALGENAPGPEVAGVSTEEPAPAASVATIPVVEIAPADIAVADAEPVAEPSAAEEATAVELAQLDNAAQIDAPDVVALQMPNSDLPALADSAQRVTALPEAVAALPSATNADAVPSVDSSALPPAAASTPVRTVAVAAPSSQPGDAIDASAVMSGWTLELPFRARDGAPTTIESLSADAPPWMRPGQRIVSVNGIQISSLTEINRILRPAILPGVTGIEANILYQQPNSQEVLGAVAVFAPVHDVALLNGIQFRTRLDQDGEWVTVVTASPSSNDLGLIEGDRLVAYIPTSEKIDTENAIAEILGREINAGTSQFPFAVGRNGAMWVATLAYRAN